MKKIQFDIKYRPEIEAGKYKVVTRDGRDVRILCWDANQFYPICAQYRLCAGTLVARYFDCNGIFEGSGETENDYDLFLVPAEPELTDFEKALGEFAGFAISGGQVESNMPTAEFVKGFSAKLLEAARKELQPEKDLPRWRKATGKEQFNEWLLILTEDWDNYPWTSKSAEEGFYYIPFSDLKKLPKEE